MEPNRLAERILIELQGIERFFRMGETTVKALHGVDLTVREGEFVSIMGPSGSGKSTLLYILGCLDRQTGGCYRFRKRELMKLNDRELSLFRNSTIGFAFQSFNLLNNVNIVHNVELPLIYCNVVRAERRRRIDRVLKALGMYDKRSHTPLQLSGGQAQRVAIARALINTPDLLLADEPTGNLDSRTGLEITRIFQELNRLGMTVIMVTHNDHLAQYSKRIIKLRDGTIVDDGPVEDPLTADVEFAEPVDFAALYSVGLNAGNGQEAAL